MALAHGHEAPVDGERLEPAPVAPPTVLAGSAEAVSLERPPTPEDSSRARAWPSVDGDRAIDRLPPADVPTASPETSAADPAALGGEAEPPATEPRVGSATPRTVSPSATPVGELPVDAAWLAEREGLLLAIRADYEAAREQALAAPGVAPGWQPPFSQEIIAWSEGDPIYGPPVGRVVWLPDPDRPREIIGWSEGDPIYRPVGRSVEFSEEAFAAHYRALGGDPRQRLAALYGGSDAASLLAAHPELWRIATADHALNAGPPPPGFAMADAGQLGMLDLYLADPQIAALVDAYGGTPAPATGGVAIEQVRLFGEHRYEQMTRLANAMTAVRTQYADALAQAQRTSGGPGWVERELTYTDDISGQPWVVKYPGWDRDAFTDWYLAQGGAEHQAFATFYGRSHTQYATSEDGRTGHGLRALDGDPVPEGQCVPLRLRAPRQQLGQARQLGAGD